MGRYSHDGSGSVIHQDIVRDPDRNLLARIRIYSLFPGIDPFFLSFTDILAYTGGLDFLVNPGLKFFPVFNVRYQFLTQRMFRRQSHECGPVNRIHPGRKDLYRPGRIRERKSDMRSCAFSYPVFLHQKDMFWPFVQPVMTGEKFLGVICYFQEPLFHFFLFDESVTPPASVSDNLLVGQDSLTLRTPVHPAFFAIGQIFVEHLEENPLVPLVVFWKTCVHLSRPVITETQSFQLPFHVRNIIQSPFLGMYPLSNGRIFCGHTQGIPADGMNNVKSFHGHVAGNHISDRIIPYLPHVYAA